MLTSEVVFDMWKRIFMSVAALGFAVVSNLSLCCRVSVGGRELDGVYSPFQVDRGVMAAWVAAEEIVSGPALLPAVERRYTLSLRPAGGSSAAVSSALMDCVPGVELNHGVYINNVYLGSVSHRDELLSQLRSFILGQLPSWAESGYLSQELSFREQYAPAGSTTPVEDMVLLASGMAPVMYSDGQGYVARA